MNARDNVSRRGAELFATGALYQPSRVPSTIPRNDSLFTLLPYTVAIPIPIQILPCRIPVIMSAEDEQSQSGYEEGNAGGPGAPTPLIALEGTAGLTKRDIQLFVDGGYNTVESIAYTPKKLLEQIKGISEQKATKILTEGTALI